MRFFSLLNKHLSLQECTAITNLKPGQAFPAKGPHRLHSDLYAGLVFGLLHSEDMQFKYIFNLHLWESICYRGASILPFHSMDLIQNVITSHP